MATDFTSSKKTVNRDLTSVVYKNYMQGEWGVESGYNTVPDWYAYMRKSQLEWLEEQDCADGLNSIANNQMLPNMCPPCFEYKTTSTGVAFCFRPPNACGLGLAAAEQPPIPLTILVSGPLPGCNPFPSIHHKDRCKIAKIPLCPTALIFQFSSKEYWNCN